VLKKTLQLFGLVEARKQERLLIEVYLDRCMLMKIG